MKNQLKSSGWGLVLLAACACQTVLGDFTVAPAPEEPGAEALGTACEPGEYRCTNELLERCSDDRSGFVVAETCASAAECNVNTRSCRPCIPGEWMCRGDALERCDEAGAWVHEATCETPALCSVAPNHLSGACAPAICAAGVHECHDATLVRCTPSRGAFEAVALCENPELCDAAYADELAAAGERGACRPAVCEPGARTCDGAILRRCAFDRKAWGDETVCDSPDLCNVTNGACAPCEPGAVECNGAELRRCRASGGWETLATCAAVALCDSVAETCRDAECNEPGRLRCASGGLLERCSENLTWEVAAACATRELCSVAAGRCLTPACALDAVRCNGKQLEQCRSDRTRWDVVQTCTESERCEPEGGCVPAPCTEGALRCNDASLERCTSSRFEEIERCETPVLCDAAAGRCAPPACTADYECRAGGTIIRKCFPGRDGFDDNFRTCPGGTTCDASPGLGTGLPQCDACTPNAYACDGTTLSRCSSDGQALETVGICPTSCVVSPDAPTCN